MFGFAKKNIFKISGLILLLGLLAFFSFKEFSKKPFNANAMAGVPGNIPLRGWLWTDTIGWIQLNGLSQDNNTYGITVSDTGNFDANSWAWSENVGWVAFFRPSVCSSNSSIICTSSADCGGTDECYPVSIPYDADNSDFSSYCANCNDSENCSACYDNNTKKIYGWMYVLSMGKRQGWIKLNGTNYGVSVLPEDILDKDIVKTASIGKSTWGDFSGWAWGWGEGAIGNLKPGIGWVSFNCVNQSSCGKSNYFVTGRPERPTITSVGPTVDAESTSITVKWQASLGAKEYKLYRREGHCANVGASNFLTATSCNSGAALPTGCSTCQMDEVFHPAVNGSGAQLITPGLDINDTLESAPPTKPLELGINYYYILRACNMFGCSLSNEAMAMLNRIGVVKNLSITPTCSAAGGPKVALTWSLPDIIKPAGAPTFLPFLDYYQVEYCTLDANLNKDTCVWQKANGTCSNSEAANHCNGGNCSKQVSALKCVSGTAGRYKDCYNGFESGNCNPTPAMCNVKAVAINCADSFSSNYNKKTNYHIYRVRLMGTETYPDKRCFGGDKNGSTCETDNDCIVAGQCVGEVGNKKCSDINSKAGTSCTADSQCSVSAICSIGTCSNNVNTGCRNNADCGGNICNARVFAGGWAYTKPFRLCSSGNTYQEVRPN